MSIDDIKIYNKAIQADIKAERALGLRARGYQLWEEGMTALQDEIAERLRKAMIPETYITSILGTIACGERERQWIDDIEQLWERYRGQSEDATEAPK